MEGLDQTPPTLTMRDTARTKKSQSHLFQSDHPFALKAVLHLLRALIPASIPMMSTRKLSPLRDLTSVDLPHSKDQLLSTAKQRSQTAARTLLPTMSANFEPTFVLLTASIRVLMSSATLPMTLPSTAAAQIVHMAREASALLLVKEVWLVELQL
jgi:hypothetical protein